MTSADAVPRIERIAAIVLRSKRPAVLAAFYRDAFDFVDDASSPAADVALRLGTTRLRIECAGAAAAPYPADVPGWSPLFQHFAIRVTAMDAAFARLAAVDGWRPISTAGPETLPANTGGVVAFKFRDPDGHPLELIEFPDRRDGPLFAGIDHTAISVADVERSIAFYEALGFVVGGRSLNTGPAQARLDAIPDATVDVGALRTASGTAPHLELLCYRGPFDRASAGTAQADDVAATRWVGAASGAVGAADGGPAITDPDGHCITLAR